MSAPNEQRHDGGLAASKAPRVWGLVLWVMAALLGLGVLLRMAGLPIPGWVLVAWGGAMAFIFILPAIGGRMHEPEDSPFKRAPWST